MNLFGYGFRPFFLLAGLSAPLLLVGWLCFLFHGKVVSSLFDPMNWHAHEMLFGFVSAMIAGFLLTAVPNWTGEPAKKGAPLVLLSTLWLSARCLLLTTGSWLTTIVDLAFFPVLFGYLFPPLWRKGQVKTLIFVPVLLTLWTGNLLMHLQARGLATTAHAGIVLATGMIVLLIVIIAGRVVPFFTTIALGGKAAPKKAIETLSVVTTILLPVLGLWSPPALVCLVWSAVACIVHGLRLRSWWRDGIWNVPLLWILHLGYGWIIVGFALIGLSAMGWVGNTAALHAFTAGSISSVGLGIMARASLGHTGRPLRPSSWVVCSFVIVNMAAILRVFGPLTDLPRAVSYGLGGSLWSFAFLLFVGVYAPILATRRPDGKPG